MREILKGNMKRLNEFEQLEAIVVADNKLSNVFAMIKEIDR